jgi:hypothetical protein
MMTALLSPDWHNLTVHVRVFLSHAATAERLGFSSNGFAVPARSGAKGNPRFGPRALRHKG